MVLAGPRVDRLKRLTGEEKKVQRRLIACVTKLRRMYHEEKVQLQGGPNLQAEADPFT